MRTAPPCRPRRRPGRVLIGALVLAAVACAAACSGGGDAADWTPAGSAAVDLPEGIRAPSDYQIQRGQEILRQEKAKTVPPELATKAALAAETAKRMCPLDAQGYTGGATSPQEAISEADILARELVDNYPLAEGVSELAVFNPGIDSVFGFYNTYVQDKVDGGCVEEYDGTLNMMNSNTLRMVAFDAAMMDPPRTITANFNTNRAFFSVMAEHEVYPSPSGFKEPEPADSPEDAVRAFLDSLPPEVLGAFEWSRIHEGYEVGPVDTDDQGNARVCIAANTRFPESTEWPVGGYTTYVYYLSEEAAGWTVVEISGHNFMWPLESRPSPSPSMVWQETAGSSTCPERPD